MALDLVSPGRDVPNQIHKDLEQGNRVGIEGWRGAEDAKKEIVARVERHQRAPERPVF
ncbi:MAG: hypothetical protein WB784_05570 [Rhodanobacteraceae bacterium]